jgi:hypothetical protein
MKPNPEAIYRPSENIVARKIEGEIIIVPLTCSVGEAEDDLYTLNETGKDIWELLNGKLTMKEIVHRLTDLYEAPIAEIEKDVTALVGELLSRGILV